MSDQSKQTTDLMFSTKTKELLAGVKKMVPPLLDHFHKGQMGRVGVVGGSQDYTGAPYFSANASARLGCDMSHVICEPDAAQVIKTYSPNLMIHPMLHLSHKAYPSLPKELQTTDPTVLAKPIIELLPRLHSLVFGPGLGRDPLMLSTVREVLLAAKQQKVPFVVDADALSIVNDDPQVIHGYKLAILTPNVVEFGRLAKAVGVDLDLEMSHQADADDVPRGAAETAAVSNKLGGVIVVRKGKVDYISDGKTTLTCDLEGGLKRSGGQGDTLTGSIGTLLAWRDAYLNDLWDVGKDKMGESETMLLAAFGGCSITRECSRLAYKQTGRALQASDVGDQVPLAFKRVIGEKDDEWSMKKSSM